MVLPQIIIHIKLMLGVYFAHTITVLFFQCVENKDQNLVSDANLLIVQFRRLC